MATGNPTAEQGLYLSGLQGPGPGVRSREVGCSVALAAGDAALTCAASGTRFGPAREVAEPPSTASGIELEGQRCPPAGAANIRPRRREKLKKRDAGWGWGGKSHSGELSSRPRPGAGRAAPSGVLVTPLSPPMSRRSPQRRMRDAMWGGMWGVKPRSRSSTEKQRARAAHATTMRCFGVVCCARWRRAWRAAATSPHRAAGGRAGLGP
eukprot:scaffold10522_cov62-Phaeocystis_antarctica.AAC.7